MTQTISLAATNTMLSSSVNPAQPGDSVTFTATVQPIDPSAGTPTGTVTFYNGTTALGTVALDANGNATYTTSFGTGDYAISAIYSGDDDFAGSSDWVDQTVGQPSTIASEMDLSSTVSPSLPGQEVTFTASVVGLDEGGTPTGSVTFYDGTTVLGTVTLDANGNATYTTSALPLGDHNITAIYSGDGTYSGSNASMIQSIAQGGTTTSLTADANPSPEGQDVTFTAIVEAIDPSAGTPTGTVNFYDGTTLLGTGTLTLVNGQMQATFTTAAMGLGSHTIIAIYSGDSTFADSGGSLQEEID